jgi:hypothetical protein
MIRRRNLLVGATAATMLGTAKTTRAAFYPEPSGEPGAPFGDPNLKLVVMSVMMDKGILNLGTREELAGHVLGRAVDLDTEGHHPLLPVRTYLERYPLTREMLDQVDTLYFDGGNTIYSYIWKFWSGEDDSFDVASMAGIANCPSITALDLTSMIRFVDLETLKPPLKLQYLTLGVDLANLPALLDMPALRGVKIYDDDIYRDVMTPGSPARHVMERLKARGVSVWVHWISSDQGEPPAYQ